MQPYLTEHFGNPSSIHGTGRRARLGARRGARDGRAHLGAKPREIVFTSGGTEADNLALKGVALGRQRGRAPGGDQQRRAQGGDALVRQCWSGSASR